MFSVVTDRQYKYFLTEIKKCRRCQILDLYQRVELRYLKYAQSIGNNLKSGNSHFNRIMDSGDVFNITPQREDGRFCVLQITDTHLFEDENGTLLGIKTRDSFQAVLDAVKAEAKSVDFVVVTGDISQDYSAQSYIRFAEMVSCFSVPVFFLPGNHDDGPLEYRMFGNLGVSTSRHVICGSWQFVFLNSEVYAQAHGWVEREELELLQEAVMRYPDKNTVALIHHLPLLVGSAWLDTQTLHNQDEFRAFLRHMRTVKLVLSGHVHQEIDEMRCNIRYLATPSTSIQFMPGSQDFELDTKAPGWRYLTFNSDGSFESSVHRLGDNRFSPDFNARGY